MAKKKQVAKKKAKRKSGKAASLSKTASSKGDPACLSRGRTREGASFPAAPQRSGLPVDYGAALAEIKRRIAKERLRVVLSANSAMVLLYWDVGRTILDRQARAGWGAKVIDRLSQDLRSAFPDGHLGPFVVSPR